MQNSPVWAEHVGVQRSPGAPRPHVHEPVVAVCPAPAVCPATAPAVCPAPAPAAARPPLVEPVRAEVGRRGVGGVVANRAQLEVPVLNIGGYYS